MPIDAHLTGTRAPPNVQRLTAPLLLCLAALPAAAQRLEVPSTAPIDQAFAIRAVGLRPGEQVTLRASLPDSSGRPWRAEATFRADRRGVVDASRHPALGGAYTGIRAMGLIAAMRPAGDPLAAVYAPPSHLRVPLELELVRGGRVVHRRTVVRGFLAPGTSTHELDGAQGLAGTLFLPPGRGTAPGVLVLGGSEGGNSAREVAALLASRGFAALSLAYFAADGLPAELDRIPLERVSAGLRRLAAEPRVDSARLAMVGTSKGAEAALLAASFDPRVRAVVAYAPSSVAWSCICSTPDHPSWTWRGDPVPFVPPGRDPAAPVRPGDPLRPVVHYRYRMRDPAVRAAAAIPVERIRGPIMLIAGDADQLWPSGEMAREIEARRRAAGSGEDRLRIYPAAGHRIPKGHLPAGSTRAAGGRLETGGDPMANAAAGADAWPAVLAFLSAALQPRP